MGRRPKALTQATQLGETAQRRTMKLGIGNEKRIVALQRTQGNEIVIDCGSATEKNAIIGLKSHNRKSICDEENLRITKSSGKFAQQIIDGMPD